MPVVGSDELRRVGVPVTSVWRGPDAATPVDDAITRDVPDAQAWTDGLDVEARSRLDGRVDTQALLGEPVLVLAERDGWAQVRLPWQPSTAALDGYPGWIPSAHLADGLAPACADGAVVVARITEALAEGGETITLSFGTVLCVLDATSAEVVVAHPDGRTLRLGRSDVALPDERPARDAIELVRPFADLPYLWGGLSGHGVDCSGLVHLAHRVLGRVVPRDAHDQAAAGAPVPVEEVRPGDAVFFENATGVHHTGLALDAVRLFHSPCTGKDVREGSIVGDYPGERYAFRRFAR